MQKKKPWRCPKCKSLESAIGHMKIGPVFRSQQLGFRSEMHAPYADHVNVQTVHVCRECGYAEIYFDVEDLRRKTRNK